MTVAERPPIYTPSGKGWKASYALTFATDLVHDVYLLGANQSDPIAARTLSVDNTANATAAMVNVRGSTTPIAPYALQYIDCTGQTNVQVTGGSASATIALDVLSYEVKEQSIIKKTVNVGGLPPISFYVSGSTSQGVWTQVVPLGSGITAFINFNVPTGTGTSTQWGFNGSTVVGTVVIGDTQVISMDSSVQKFWIRTVGPVFSQNEYAISGG